MIIKCRMCGGDISFVQGDTVGQCDHCGSFCTVPNVDEEQKLNRYNRANHFRRQNEFDKAITAYERILDDDNTDAEAHWGIVLSRYGIEYVEDPVSHKRIPTCHRVQVSSILADEDYVAAVEYAPDDESRSLYIEQAKDIAEIQKGILAISQNEEPYDVFICYKEADENGNRTKDSTIAQEIYYGLTELGYRVFFSRITLEDKLGHEYEPYIFAALNSAKVMIVIGTKPEYFEAVWVRNEWSRFLSLVKADRKRLLIPCYRDMDAYELPEELGNLQSQDMGKIGFMQDLIRGIQKQMCAGKTTEKIVSAPSQEIVSTGIGNVNALLDRIFISLEDEEFEKADELCERVLNIDARNANAYLGKMLADLKVPKVDDLEVKGILFDTHPQYKKILRFGDEELQLRLKTILDTIRERKQKNAEAASEVERITRQYKIAVREYCIAELQYNSEKSELDKGDKFIEEKKKEIAFFKKELEHLSGLFSGKRRGELETALSERKNALAGLLKTREMIEMRMKIIKDDMTEKPDHRNLTYQIADIYTQVGLYEKAAEEYIKILDFKDVAEIVNGNKYLAGIIAGLKPYRDGYVWEEKKEGEDTYAFAYDEAKEYILKTNRSRRVESFKKIGNIVQWGKYRIAPDADNEPIEWIVLSVNNGRALLMSKYGLVNMPFNSTYGAVNWESSTLRRWLNTVFFNQAFSIDEQFTIIRSNISNDKSQGNVTIDNVFLLSYTESLQYLTGTDSKICISTLYAQSQGGKTIKKGVGSWWLRSPGSRSGNASCIFGDGSCHDVAVTDAGVLVRPAIWVDLNRL